MTYPRQVIWNVKGDSLVRDSGKLFCYQCKTGGKVNTEGGKKFRLKANRKPGG